MDFKNTIDLLTQALEGPKPGLQAQLRMATDPRPGHKTYDEVKDSCRHAGVLVLLYPQENRLYLVLTRRTARLDHHQSQISFPGGQQEESEDIEQTALREAWEELAVRSESIRILGKLTPLYVPPSRYCIYPVVAMTDERPGFQPSEEEVEELIEVPVDHLLDPQSVHEETWTYRGVRYKVPFFRHGKHKIWGATAMVLAELMAVWPKSHP